MDRTVLGPTGTPYSQGVKVAGQTMIFISGQLAIDETGRVVSPGVIEDQARFIFKSIERLVREGGGTMANVVKITAFVTTLDGYASYGTVRREVFENALPASATVQVTSLVTPGCVIEIDAIAVL
jgi:enamine deaminase RidA (YjgF/YER057c/UK114 family)